MWVAELIDQNLPVLKPEDTVEQALNFMLDEKLGQLVMSLNNELLFYDEDTLLSYDGQLAVSSISPKYRQLYLLEDTHIAEAVNLLLKYELDLCPVLSHKEAFLGLVRASELYKQVLRRILYGDGAMIGLRVAYNDYSLSQISRIVEMEGLRIERLYMEDKSELEYHLIIKFNSKEISRVVKSLERYGFKTEQISHIDNIDNIDKERFGLLMKYLEI